MLSQFAQALNVNSGLREIVRGKFWFFLRFTTVLSLALVARCCLILAYRRVTEKLDNVSCVCLLLVFSIFVFSCASPLI